MPDAVGRVVSLWRYPVKSMLGESLPSVIVDSRGVAGDRLCALRDSEGKFGSGKTTRRFRRIDGLLGFQASLQDGTPVIRFPDGRKLRGDDPGINAALSEALGLAVTLVREDRVSHFDNSALHLITSASLEWLRGQQPESAIDARRFRPNIVVEVAEGGLIEQAWVGRTLSIGHKLRIQVTAPTARCVMITHQQDELPSDVRILRTLASVNQERFGVYAGVITPGRISCGDAVILESGGA
jgi:uncharacterized protein YcbX